MSTPKQSKPNPPRARFDDLASVKLLRDIAQHPGDEHVILETSAHLAGFASWSSLFSHAPLFPDRLDFGSPNKRAMWSALGLFHPATFPIALASWQRAAQLESTIGFELEEPGSRIYRSWSLMGRLAGYRFARQTGITVLQDYFASWLSLYWYLEQHSFVETREGYRSLRCGARSEGMFDINLADYASCLTLGFRFRFVRGKNKFWEKSPEIQFFDAMRDEILSSSARFIDVNWPSIATTHYLKTTQGLAVWLDKGEPNDTSNNVNDDDVPNSNTAGIAAMGVNSPGGEVWSLPRPSRIRIRQKTVIEQVTTRYDNSRPVSLTYRSSGALTTPETTQQLPSGEVIYLIRHDSTGIKQITHLLAE